MTQIATVCERKETRTVVEVRRKSACAGCHAGGCLGCGKNVRVEAENSVGAECGDVVEIEATTSGILLHAALVFLMPLLLAAGLYGIGKLFLLAESLCYLLALTGIALSFGVLILYTRMRGVQVSVRIIRVLETETTEERGGNHAEKMDID